MNQRIKQLGGRLRSLSARRSVLPLCFLLPSAVFLAICILRGLLLRGDGTFLYYTIPSELLPYLRAMNGEGSLVALLQTADPDIFLAILPYAINPVNRLYALFGASGMATGALLISALRIGLAGLTFGAYLQRKGDMSSFGTAAFALLYALSSYALLMQFAPTYIDSVILLPIVILGVERLVAAHRPALFAAALSLSFLTNVEAIFPILLFSLLYLITYRVSRADFSLRCEIHLAALTLVSVGIATLLSLAALLPVGASLSGSAEGLRFEQTFGFLDLIAKLAPGAYDGIEHSNYPYLSVGMLPLLLIPVYFTCRDIPRRERVCVGSLFFILYFTFSIEWLNAAWNLFRPTAPAYTHAFLFIFLFLSTASRAFTHLSGASERVLVPTSFVLLLLFSIIQKLDLTYTVTSADGQAVTEKPYVSEVTALWLPLFFVILYTALLLLVIRRKGLPRGVLRRCAVPVALILAVSVEALCAGSELIKLIGKDGAGFASDDYTSTYSEAVSEGLGKISPSHPFRVAEIAPLYSTNPLYYRYLSLDGIDPAILQFFALTDPETNALSDDVTLHAASLFGIRHILLRERIPLPVKESSKKEEETEIEYDDPGQLPASLADYLTAVGGSDLYTLYENPYALPAIFASVGDVSKIDWGAHSDSAAAISDIWRILTGDTVFRSCTYTYEDPGANIDTQLSTDSYTVFKPISNLYSAALEYTVKASASGPLYCTFYAPDSTLYRSLSVRVNGVSVATIAPNDGVNEDGSPYTPKTLFIADLRAGESVTVSFYFGTNSDARIYVSNEYLNGTKTFFHQTDLAAMRASAEDAEKCAPTDLSVRGNTLSGSVRSLVDGAYLFTTVPSDYGWSVEVDGKKVDADPSSPFLIVPLGEAGEHTFEIKHASGRATAGMGYAISGALLLLALVLTECLTVKGILKPILPGITKPRSGEASEVKEDEDHSL